MLAGLLALLVLQTVVRADLAVSFPDPSLEAAVREALSMPSGDISESDLAGLVSLSADGRGIVDLAGLEHCTKMTTLSLLNNQITDLMPLSGLTSLVTLGLSTNKIRDISPLSGLSGLQHLSLAQNEIGDISPLVKNPGIETGGHVNLRANPLNSTSINTWIPALQERGVDVVWDSAPGGSDDIPAGVYRGLPTWAWVLIGVATLGVAAGASWAISRRLAQRKSSKAGRRPSGVKRRRKHR